VGVKYKRKVAVTQTGPRRDRWLLRKLRPATPDTQYRLLPDHSGHLSISQTQTSPASCTTTFT